MAWTAPMTAVANSAFTAAQFNTYVRDNLNETAPAKATTAGSIFVATGANAIAERRIVADTVSTSQTTTSTSFTNLATVGPAVTVTTGTSALVIISCQLENSTASANSYISHACSGATTYSADVNYALKFRDSGTNQGMSASYVTKPDLTPGSNTFTAKYAVSSGTGTFFDRRIIVIPL